jgi:hypothetical protein
MDAFIDELDLTGLRFDGVVRKTTARRAGSEDRPFKEETGQGDPGITRFADLASRYRQPLKGKVAVDTEHHLMSR